MSNNIDLQNVKTPKPKTQGVDHSNFNVHQRRAEMMRIILEQGHSDIHQTKMAKLYGMSQSQINKDLAVVIAYISDNYFKPSKLVSDALTAKQKALREAIRANQWSVANKISDSILNCAFDLGLIKKEATKIDVAMKEEIEKIVLPKITIKPEDLK